MRGVSIVLTLLIFITFVVMFVVPLRHSLPMWAEKSLSGAHTTSSTTMDNTTHPFFKLTSDSFKDGDSIPATYTCDGTRDLSPALSIAGVPTDTKSLALIMDDPDVPKALKPEGVFDHWVLFNIPSDTKKIPEGESVGTPGVNSAGNNTYASPCPPPQYEPAEHRYVFTLYALDMDLPLSAGASKDSVLGVMHGHVIAQTQLIGRYKKK